MRLEWAIAVGLFKKKCGQEWRKKKSFPTLKKYKGKKEKKYKMNDVATCYSLVSNISRVVLSFTLFCCESFTGHCFILFVFKHRFHLFTELYRRNIVLKTKLWENQLLYKWWMANMNTAALLHTLFSSSLVYRNMQIHGKRSWKVVCGLLMYLVAWY